MKDSKYAKRYLGLITTDLGGPGSGNHGHKGRPGQVGGSDDDGIANSQPSKNPTLSKSGPRRIHKDEEIAKMASSEFSQWESKLLPAEKKALVDYARHDYNEINEALRFNEYTGDKKVDKRTNDQIFEIDEALYSSPGFSQDTAVYRGIDFDEGFEVGDTFVDKGFVSTSLSSTVAAENFALLGGEDGVLLEINYPKGLPCGYLSNIKGNTAEQEILLPRNIEFEIVGISSHDVYDTGNEETYTIKVYHVGVVDILEDYEGEEDD